MEALLYLQWRQIVNGVLSTLRSPKRLVFALLFLVWMGSSFAVGLIANVSRLGSQQNALTPPEAYLQLGALGIILILTFVAVERGLTGSVFAFRPADYDFLFPTPINRRLVVTQRTAVDALAIVFWLGVFTVSMVAFLPIRGVTAGVGAGHLVRMWIACSFYSLAMVNLARILQLVAAGWEVLSETRVKWLRVAAWVAMGVVVLGAGHAFLEGATSAETLLNRLQTPPLKWVLLPALSASAAIAGGTPPVAGSMGLTLAGLGLLAAACLVGVCLLDADVVEATVEHSANVARIRAAARAQDTDSLTAARLGDLHNRRAGSITRWWGPAEPFAFKTVAEMSRGGLLRWVGTGVFVVLAAALGAWVPDTPAARYGPGPVVMYLLLLLAGVFAMRFRSELNRVALLRSLPLPPWRQMAGLVLPRAIVQALVLSLALSAYTLARPVGSRDLESALIVAMPFAVTIVYLLGAISACVFPLGTDAGQRFFSGMLLMAGAGIALAPPAILIGVGLVAGGGGLTLGLAAGAVSLPIIFLLALLGAVLLGRFEPGDE